jgi:hypothetical protein
MLMRPDEASFSRTLFFLELPTAKLDFELPASMLELVLFIIAGSMGERLASAISSVCCAFSSIAIS